MIETKFDYSKYKEVTFSKIEEYIKVGFNKNSTKLNADSYIYVFGRKFSFASELCMYYKSFENKWEDEKQLFNSVSFNILNMSTNEYKQVNHSDMLDILFVYFYIKYHTLSKNLDIIDGL